mmetsp:Transcript_28528/g.71592  ORF Transcript_28528/g.71592 Transcript_28528/m.71592 type:complete len:310 (-) Transcript_28528:871-1800(-)
MTNARQSSEAPAHAPGGGAPRYSPTDSVHTSVKALPFGQRATLNDTGFEMSTTSPVFPAWVAAFDGTHPLVDIGCAYGRNSVAAAEIINPLSTASPGAVTVVAVDCDPGHLKHVDAIGVSGVVTLSGRLPDDLPIAKLRLLSPDGVSSVLVSEVMHFLSGEALAASLRTIHDVLVPGGKLCMNAGSPHMNLMPNDAGYCPLMTRVRETHAAREAAGEAWPGECVELRSTARAAMQEGGGDWSAGGGIERMPGFLHFLSVEVLARACVEAGFDIVSAKGGWHPGYPPQYMNKALESHLENTQIVAEKRRL